MKEMRSVRALFDQRFDTALRSIVLINRRETLGHVLIATIATLDRALDRLASIMNLDEDILFVFISSHGSKEDGVSVRLWPFALRQLTPERLRARFTERGIKWKVVVISACYSGGFVYYLKDDYSLIMTAAAPDATSFCCGDRFDFTYFGKAYFDEELRTTYSFAGAFEGARRSIAERETQERLPASRPQIHLGTAMQAKLARLESRLSREAR